MTRCCRARWSCLAVFKSRCRLSKLVGWIGLASLLSTTPHLLAKVSVPDTGQQDTGQQESGQLGQRAAKLFAKENLVPWCIVPFDAARRNPEQRVAMLQELGLSRCAYDWREEHVATFEQEILAYRAGQIQFFAFWAWHEQAAALFEKHELRPQFWVMIPDPGPLPPAERVSRAADQLVDLAGRTQKLGAPLGLYNHGGWSGQPENMMAVCDELHRRGFPHVGIAYNFHHAHDRILDWPKIFPQLKRYLHCLNLNGMNEGANPKILAIGAGQFERDMIRVILEHDYQGPIGILDHQEVLDSKIALDANLEGLARITSEFLSESNQESDPRHSPSATRVEPATRTVASFLDAIPSEPNLEYAAQMAERARELGNPTRGARVFADPKFACVSCHQVDSIGGNVGPRLSNPSTKRSTTELALSVLWPQHQVDPAYSVWQALTMDGAVLSGYRRDLPEQRIGFANTATLEMVEVAETEIEELQEIGSPMPDGLAQSMSSLQRLDLLAYLQQLQNGGATYAGFLDEAYRRSRTHQWSPEPSEVTRPPFIAEHWPNATRSVNRDRIYDFYKKQAALYRQAQVPPMLLGYFHSLDGPNTGHWGNQDEAYWASDRWNQTELDGVQMGVFRGQHITVPRGICVQLGDAQQLSVCFDPDSLTYPLVWKNGFVSFSSVRHGFMDGLRMTGQRVEQLVGDKPTQPFRYLGMYRAGPRVVFAYQIGDTTFLDAPWAEGEQMTRVVAPIEQHPLKDLLNGAAPRHPEVLETAIEFGSGSPYAVDTIALPIENPWRALLFCSGHGFMTDGSAYVCTMQGDVWHVRGFAGPPQENQRAQWRRFASGLHQPLGLVVANGLVHVMCRDQLVVLHDRNADGEADFYECLSNAFATSAGGHDYICGLERDAEGNFYTASSNQGLIKISADGETVEVLATGFRNPDGLGLWPDGTLTVPCSEGDWTPGSMIAAVPSSRNVSASPANSPRTPPHFGYPGRMDGTVPQLPWLYLPRGVDNSAGGQVWVDSDRWGPLQDQVLHLSFGAGSHFLLLPDRIETPTAELPAWIQGAAVPLVGDFRSGAHRGRFNPRDGQLYVTGMNGWGTYTPDDGCFQRVRYTGQPVVLPTAIKIYADGIWLKFSQPLDQSVAEAANHFAQAWNYRYSSSYGSPEFSISHTEVPGHDWMAITHVSLSAARDELFLQMPDLRPVNQLHLNLALNEAAVEQPGLTTDLFVTIHQLAGPFDRWSVPAFGPKLLTRHPIFRDLEQQQERIPNPWSRELSAAQEMEISTGENLSYQTPQLEVQAGKTIKLTLNNVDSVPHNWVLLQPDSLARVGQLANQLLADPAAGQKQYVPDSPDVICYTDVVPPGQTFTIFFQAPTTPGRYPFLCTFPGHWMVMNGVLNVKDR
jgi:putative heme-binding domain-containing protein